jgi:hypothetical protein
MKDSTPNYGTDKNKDTVGPIRLSDEAIKAGMDALGGPQIFQGFGARYETSNTLSKRAIIGIVKITGAVLLATFVALVVQEALPSIMVLTASAKEALVTFSASVR